MSIELQAVALAADHAAEHSGSPALEALWWMRDHAERLLHDVEDYPEDYAFDAALVRRLVEHGHVPARVFHIGSEWKALDEELALPRTTSRGGSKTRIAATYGHVDLLDSAATAKLAAEPRGARARRRHGSRPHLQGAFEGLRAFYAACARGGLAVLRGLT